MITDDDRRRFQEAEANDLERLARNGRAAGLDWARLAPVAQVRRLANAYERTPAHQLEEVFSTFNAVITITEAMDRPVTHEDRADWQFQGLPEDGDDEPAYSVAFAEGAAETFADLSGE
jgi:hypothetical protein